MNLFLTCSVGALYSVHDLIAQESLSPNKLIIFSDPDVNPEMIEQILRNADTDLFTQIEVFEMTEKIWSFRRKTIRKIRSIFIDLLDKHDFKKIFIDLIEAHYCLLAELAKERNIELNLYEEGLYTYHPLFPSHKKTSVKFTVRAALHEFLDWRKPTFSPLRAAVKILGSFFSYPQKLKIRKIFFPKNLQSVFGKIRDFSNIYVVFPEKARQIYRAEKYVKLVLKYRMNPKKQRKIDKKLSEIVFEPTDIIYIDNEFGLESHISIVLSFFAEKYKNRRIYIKLHPKSKSKEAFLALAKDENLDIRLIDLGDIEVPAEYILQARGAKNICGVFSSTLVYANECLEDVNVVSFAKYYSRMAEQAGADEKTMNFIEYMAGHLRAFDIE
ncbi:MAG: alpha-2,8-polysialyltransferase family protein [Turicibacter sp.]|nr:alpha-2,8-polysialyltransferase family protein [Turicibacter sp.]